MTPARDPKHDLLLLLFVLSFDKIEDAGGVRRHVASICAIPLIQHLTFEKSFFDKKSDEKRSGDTKRCLV